MERNAEAAVKTQRNMQTLASKLIALACLMWSFVGANDVNHLAVNYVV